jgi:hypothetical protein
MAILGTLLKKGIRLRDSLVQEYSSPLDLQKQELKKLMIKAKDTEFAKKYHFDLILKEFKQGEDEFYKAFCAQVPIYNYDLIYNEWWYRLREGEKNITWPGSIRHFALTSGTSGAASKYIPITKDMVKAIRKTGVRQILSLSKYDLPDKLFTKGILMLGGSTDLEFNGTYFSGDLSGITTGRLPIWFQRFYKPGKKISKNKNWGDKAGTNCRTSSGLGYRDHCRCTCMASDFVGKNHRAVPAKDHPRHLAKPHDLCSWGSFF